MRDFASLMAAVFGLLILGSLALFMALSMPNWKFACAVVFICIIAIGQRTFIMVMPPGRRG